jgi:glyoxylase-like metal-dependent hydrolase (beta-lactamase superfamily II)
MKLVVTFLMSAALATAGAACSRSSKAAAPAQPVNGEAQAAATVFPFKIGALDAVALQDGEFVVPNDGKTLWPGQTVDEVGALLTSAGLQRDTIRLSIQPLLVKLDGRIALFDTGAGGAFPTAGHLGAALAAAGVSPGEITDIFISHAHSDHVGGLTDQAGGLAFPAAAIHMSAPEWAALQGDPDDKAKALTAAISGKVVAFEPGAAVLPGVRAVATMGHTPGHSSFEISSGDDKLLYLGDVVHHSIISVQRPTWSITFDGESKAAAEAMRQQTLAALAAGNARVYAVHFPFPGLGHVVAQGDGFVWQAE